MLYRVKGRKTTWFWEIVREATKVWVVQARSVKDTDLGRTVDMSSGFKFVPPECKNNHRKAT
jgi:hypothetical protein